MANLPQFQSDNIQFQMMQSKWGSILNPIIANPLTNPSILQNVQLNAGINVINHKLGKKQQGWFISDIDNPSVIYRAQPLNDSTLTLNSSASAIVTLVVY